MIKVIGVGGGGSNAVNFMYDLGITGVDFVVCNTDAQVLTLSPVPSKIQLGATLTEGRGAGAQPEIGRHAALENLEDIKYVLADNTKMLFITAGMGGGTGTGATPVIAAAAREMGILTVAIVTLPFSFEGRRRKQQAEDGIRELRNHVDSLLVICNDKLRELYGDLPLSEAFAKADTILTTAAKGIAEIITVPGYINVDFEDVKTVMKNSGVAIMGTGEAEGEDRALRAVEAALSSPLLNDNDIEGAQNILLYISSGQQEVFLDEVTTITDYIQSKAGTDADIIWGNGRDPNNGQKLSITIVATGFDVDGNARKRKPITTVIGVLGAAEPAVQQNPSQQKPEEPKAKDEFKRVHPLYESPIEPEPVAVPLPEAVDETEEAPVSVTPSDQETALPPEPVREQQTAQQVIFEIDPIIPEDIIAPVAPAPVPEEITEPTLITRTPSETSELPPAVTTSVPEEVPIHSMPDRNFMDKTSNERINKLKELSLRLKSEEGIQKMEREPAYIRRNRELMDPKPSSESEVSDLSISNDPKTGLEIKTNNTFLHDHID